MPTILPLDRPILYTVYGGDVLISDVTNVGDLTGVNEELSVVADANENAYLEALLPLASAFPTLPDSGWLEAGAIYQYGESAVIVRQAHSRTEHAPEDVPALFVVYRADASDVLPWIAGEQVSVGTERTYEGKTYKCLQAHVTQADWTPPATPALWAVVPTVPEEPTTDAWAVGVAYAVGDMVTYEGVTYTCRQAHTSIASWTPPAVLALWLPV